MTAKSKVRRHRPEPDQAVPADQHGNAYCRRCGLAIVPGDPRHTLPELSADDVRTRAAGERSDG